MNPEQIIATMNKHNIAVRRIPDAVYGVYEFRHFREGDEVIQRPVQRKIDGVWQKVMIDYARRTTIPEKAGWWMAQQTHDTRSKTAWSYKHDNLSPTLGEAVEKCVNKLETPCSLST